MSLLKVNTVQTDKLQSVAGVNRNSVLQVVSKEVTTEFTTTSESFVDVTDMFLAITPTSATSKILVNIATTFRATRTSTSVFVAARILRDSTVVFASHGTDTVGNFSFGISVSGTSSLVLFGTPPLVFLDSPSTTSEITYKLQGCVYDNASSGQLAVNLNGVSSGAIRSTITLMEIAQ